MKRRTYKNVMKAAKMIEAKGYDELTAIDIALQCFNQAEQTKNGMPIEWFIEKVATAEEYKKAKDGQ